MEDIRERVRGFLAEFTSPGEKEVQSFIDDIASKNPSLDVKDFKKKLVMVVEQRDGLKVYEKHLSSLSPDSTAHKELESILRVAREGHKNLGDISSVLKKAGDFLTAEQGKKNGKTISEPKPHVETPKIQQSNIAAKLEEPVEEVEGKKDEELKEDADKNQEKHSKKSHKKGKKEKTKKHGDEAVQIESPEHAGIKVEKGVEEKAGQSAEKEKLPAEGAGVRAAAEIKEKTSQRPEDDKTPPAKADIPVIQEKAGAKDGSQPVPKPEETHDEKTEVPVVQREAGAKEDSRPAPKPEDAHSNKTEVPPSQGMIGTKEESLQQPQKEGTPSAMAEPSAARTEAATKEESPGQPGEEKKVPAGSAEAPKVQAEAIAKEVVSQKPEEKKVPVEPVKSGEPPKVQTGDITKKEISQQTEEKKTPVSNEVPKKQEETGAKPGIPSQMVEKKASVEGTAVVKDEAAVKEKVSDKPADGQPAKKGKKHNKKKEAEVPEETKLEIESPVGAASPGAAQDFLQHLEMEDARSIIKDQLTPEKQAVFELLEEKLLSDVETRIKKLKEMQSNVLEEKPPQTLVGKIKTFFTKEIEAVETYDVALHGPLVTFGGIQGYNELERYWVNEPYAFVVILFDPNNNAYLYYAAEPTLSDFEDLFLKEIKDRLKDVLLVENIKNEEDKDKILTNKVRSLIKDYAIDISPLTLEKILYYSRRDYIYFGKLDPLMHDDRIEDISANGHDIPIYLYHKKYTNIPTNIFYNENELNSYVIRLAQRCGKHISIAEPMVDATMPDGSRIQMTLGTEVTSHGATFTIRKFSEVPITPVDLIKWNTFSAEELAYLWLCIENNKSLIYAGGTASGKTSSLNAVSLFIPSQAKIVTLEDTRELKLPHPNWIPGVTRDSFTADGRGSIDMYELLRAALRQRPEFLLVGEVRGKEALTLFQAMSTGHTTFSTMHADSVASAIHRLENPPISVPRTMIQALNIISIQAQTYVNGKRARRNMKLVEITDIDPTTRNIRTNDIFVWDPLTDKFLRVGESKALNEIMIRRGWSPGDLKKELVFRQKILEFMVNNKISDFNAISTIIHDYQATPDKVLTKLNITL